MAPAEMLDSILPADGVVPLSKIHGLVLRIRDDRVRMSALGIDVATVAALGAGVEKLARLAEQTGLIVGGRISYDTAARLWPVTTRRRRA